MAMVACGECRAEISDRAKQCPRCGAPNANRVRPFKGWLWGPVGVVALFFGWAAVREPSPEERLRMADRYAVEACWKEQKRKSLDASAARLVAGACEKLEADFRAKHGRAP